MHDRRGRVSVSNAMRNIFYGHICANKQLQALTVIDGCEVELVEDEFFDTVEEEQGPTTECMALSFNSFAGITHQQLQKLKEELGS